MSQQPASTSSSAIVWPSVITVISAAILIGAEVFGAAFAGGWALAILFGLDDTAAHVLQAVLFGIGVLIMVSFFVKQALLNVAADLKLNAPKPKTKAEWADLMRQAGVKGIHIAERDTQRAKKPKEPDVFVNTWSVEGFLSEGVQPSELGWGTHALERSRDLERTGDATARA